MDALKVPENFTLRLVLAALLAGSGLLVPLIAFRRWARSERALRTNQPLPASGLVPGLAALLAVTGLVLLAAILFGRFFR